jgi:hypothetical protein
MKNEQKNKKTLLTERVCWRLLWWGLQEVPELTGVSSNFWGNFHTSPEQQRSAARDSL